MNQRVRRDFRLIIGWGLAAFIVVNAFSWSPGSGGRNDRKPGMEVERFFGWPACFYCDLWRSDHNHEVHIGPYIPPIPTTSGMYYVYSSQSLLALLLDTSLALCGIVICLLLVWAEHRERTDTWVMILGVISAAAVLAIIMFGDEVSACL